MNHRSISPRASTTAGEACFARNMNHRVSTEVAAARHTPIRNKMTRPMPDFDRSERLAKTLRRELAQVLAAEAGDSRFNLLSISHVRMSRDLSFADIYVVSLNARESEQRRVLLKSLRRAAGFLRTRLASRIQWIKTPTLRFHYDDLPEAGPRLEALIDSLLPTAEQRPGSSGQ